MKNRTKNRCIASLVSLALALGMLFSACLPAFASAFDGIGENIDQNSDGTVNYLVLGSSAAAGEGMLGFEEYTYPALVKAELEAAGKNVSLENLAVSGMRAEELRFLLDPSYSGDAYTAENFLGEDGIFTELGGVDALRERYTKAVADAEIITLDLGFDSLTRYALSYALFNEYEADFSLFDEEIQKIAGMLRDRFKDNIGDYFEKDAASSELVMRFIDGVAYAIVSHACSFDAVIGSIYRLNPDVDITVLSIRNPLAGLNVKISGIDTPLSEIYGIIVDALNVYMAGLSEYDGCFNFAYFGEGEVECFDTELLTDKELFPEELSDIVGEYAHNDYAKGAFISIITDALEYDTPDINAAAQIKTSIRSAVISIISATDEDNRLQNNSEYKALTSDVGSMSCLALAVRADLGCIPSLPNRSGHLAIAEKLAYAIKNSVKGRDVIENEMNEVYSAVLGTVDRDMLLDMGYVFSPYYVLDPDKSYYVAVGDGSAANISGYAAQIARELGLYDSERFTNISKNGITPADLLDPSSENYINNNIGTLKKADLITLSFNNSAPTINLFDQFLKVVSGGESEDYDWSLLLSSLGIPLTGVQEEIDGIVEMLREELLKAIDNENVANAVVAAAEGYAYAYASKIVNYPLLINRIRDINSKALLVIVGSYNDMNEVTIVFDGEEIPIGNYISLLVDAANLESLAFAALGDNIAFVTCPEIDTRLSGTRIEINTSNIFAGLFSLASRLAPFKEYESYNPLASGHTKIAEAVLENITIVPGPHTCDAGTDFDSDCDRRCNVCHAKRTTGGHKFSSPCTEVCEVEGCNVRNTSSELHVYDGACDRVCNVCKGSRSAAEHTYNGACAVACSVCGEARTSEISHSFGEWAEKDGVRTRVCSVCSLEESEELESNTAAIISVTVLAVLGGGGGVAYLVVTRKRVGIKRPEKNSD